MSAFNLIKLDDQIQKCDKRYPKRNLKQVGL